MDLTFETEFEGDQLALLLLSVVDEIYKINRKIQNEFGQQANIFVQAGAKNAVQKVRFDQLTSLSLTLKKWLQQDLTEGELILAWVNLGALLEGTMKAFLTVYFDDFEKDKENHNSSNAIHKKGSLKGTVKQPGKLKLEDLIIYFRKQKLFADSEEELAEKIKRNRNAIHAFLDSEVDGTSQFHMALRQYLSMQKRLYEQLPG